MNVEFEGVEERVGHGECAVDCCRIAMLELQWFVGLLTDWKGNILKISMAICYLYGMSVLFHWIEYW